MARQGISTGTTPNDGTGDSLLDGAIKINENFDELYTLLGDGTTLSVGVVTSLTAGANVSISTSYGAVTISVTGISTNDIDTNRLVVSGVSTLSNTVIGGGTTELIVSGDARVTGILTVGSSSITLDGSNNILTVGTGVTIYGNTGIVSATDFYANGLRVGQVVADTIIYEGATLYNAWQETSAGIHTLSNVGIGTTNPTSALTVSGLTSTTSLFSTNSATIDGLLISQDSLTGTGNIRLGDSDTLGSSSDGNYNIAIGQAALDNIRNGDNNIAIGYQAAQTVNASDSNYGNNTVIGYQAFKYLDGSSNNVAFGYQALRGPSSPGTYDTLQTVAVGANAGYNVQNTRFSSFFGHQSGYNQTSADYNTFLGYKSGYYVTTGDNNVIIGSYDGNEGGLDIRTSSNNVVLSDGSGNIRLYANSSGNVGIATTNPTTALTVGPVGSSTTQFTVNGFANINGVDIRTWPDATDSRQSVHIGKNSGVNATGGYYNTALGTNALTKPGAGDNNNVAIGYKAMESGTGGANVVIGSEAGDASTFSGNANVMIGAYSGTAMSSGTSNTLVGYSAGDSVTTGQSNTFIGRDSGASVTTGSRNIIIGNYGGTGSVANVSYPGYYPGSLDLATSTANIVIADGYGTVKMYINPDGNVGIATTNPSSKLTVRGGDISVGVSTAHGVILTSPNGTQFRLIVDDSGNLSTVAV